MSGIFGFAYLDGRPAGAEEFQKMAHAMVGWGPDGVGRKLSGSAAFGHALLIVTHESPYEKMPVHDSDTDVLFTAAARLDNRDELCDLFGIAHPERPTTPDGRLVWLAYKKWGSDSCKHIFGDWSFAAWHAKDKRLFLARDHLGNTGLYYYIKSSLIVFSTDPNAIIAHSEVPCCLNEMYLAKKMMLDVSEDIGSQTYWLGVYSLPASHLIAWKAGNKQIMKYWHLEYSPSIFYRSDEEYLEGFLEKFRRAVRVRLNSIRPIGTTLSAGLDSSSVTALAAQELQKKNKPLVAYTSVPLKPYENLFRKRLIDEWPLSHNVAEFYQNIEHIPIRADDISPLAAIRRSLQINRTQQHESFNMGWILSIFENAKRSNLAVILTGQLGNGGVSWNGGKNYIYYLFAQKQWQKGVREITAWKNRHGLSWFRALKSQILRPLILPTWAEYQSLFYPRKCIYAFAQEKLIKRLGLSHKYGSKRNIDPLSQRILTSVGSGTVAGPIWHTLGAFYKTEVRDPTADIRLLEYCIGVPHNLYTFDGGERMLIRRAMDGILPDSVRLNTIRGLQSGDIQERLMKHREELESECNKIAKVKEIDHYIDTQALNNALKMLLKNESGPAFMTVIKILRTITFGYILLRFFGNASDES